MKLVISIDVEEEGLFSGKYPRNPGVENVSALRNLAFIPQEFSLPLTLLTAYAVARDANASAIIQRWHERGWAEIGAHLHHWSTPPVEEFDHPDPVPSDLLPERLLAARLASLTGIIASRFGVQPQSFRMGRFDLGQRIRSLLPGAGIRVDSSLVPLRAMPGGPDHFLAPVAPHRLPSEKGKTGLLEAPLTLVSYSRTLPYLVYRLAKTMPAGLGHRLLTAYRMLAVVGVQPLWYPLRSMQLATRLHHRRGGKLLVMFFHSTEIFPGGSPHVPDEAAVARVVQKLRTFLTWLTREYTIEGVTLGSLAGHADAPSLPPQKA